MAMSFATSRFSRSHVTLYLGGARLIWPVSFGGVGFGVGVGLGLGVGVGFGVVFAFDLVDFEGHGFHGGYPGYSGFLVDLGPLGLGLEDGFSGSGLYVGSGWGVGEAPGPSPSQLTLYDG